jgi:hypothetical protein
MPLNNQGMMSIIPLDATFQVIKGAGHEGPQYRDKERTGLIVNLLDRQLQGKESKRK